MNLHIISSESLGNCYLLSNGRESLLIEAGVNMNKIHKAVGFDIEKVEGAFITHEHLDHSKAVPDLLYYNIPVFALQSVFDKHKKAGNTIQAHWTYKTKSFSVFTFEVKHDVPCLGFVIHHPDCGRILFMTDTCNCDYVFENINHFIVEANHSSEIIQENINSGRLNPYAVSRLKGSHMDISTTIDLINNHDKSTAANVVLLHLSSGNASAQGFKERVQRETGIRTFVADTGVIINLNKDPYEY